MMRSKLLKFNYQAIPLKVLIFMAWRNLISKKLRSALTILGVIIGIGAIFFLLSLGLGLQNLVTSEVVGNQSIKSIDVTSSNSKIIKLDQNAENKLRNLPNVDQLGSSFSYAGSLKFNNSEADTIVYGVDMVYQDLSNLNIIRGRLLQNKDSDSVYLNQAALEVIGINDPAQAIGKKLELNIPLSGNIKTKHIEKQFTVVGVIDSGSGSEVFIPSSIFVGANVGQFTQIKLLAHSTDSIKNLRPQIESMGFETSSPIDTIDQVNQIFHYFNIILAGFGTIGMIVAVLGMFNTLTISLLERTKEIGLMIALGARRRDMLRLFIFEAVLLSFIGAVVGILLASLTGAIINLAMNKLAENRGIYQHFDLFSTPLWLILSLILFMILVGLIVVFLPARHAERINPIDALRRE